MNILGDFSNEPSGRFVGRRGWDVEGKAGICFGSFYVGQWWAVVLWDGDEDPTTCKRAALKFEVQNSLTKTHESVL